MRESMSGGGKWWDKRGMEGLLRSVKKEWVGGRGYVRLRDGGEGIREYMVGY